MFASELLYQHWHFEHPHEHDLLRSLGGAHEMAMRVLLIFGACVVAPIFEEYAFRAHLQTFLRQFFIARRLSPSTGVPVEGEGVSRATFANEPPVGPDSPSLGMLAAGNSGGLNPRMQIPDSRLPTPDPRPPAPRLWQSWLAIVFASLLFAMIHPGWMRPGIFVLSLGLGYIYERTGNLWAAITMHALFNSISTIVYLNVG